MRQASDLPLTGLLGNARLKREVSEHVRDEESRLFPLLAGACAPEALDELGDKVRMAKKMAPTRPHPSAPDTPPGNNDWVCVAFRLDVYSLMIVGWSWTPTCGPISRWTHWRWPCGSGNRP